MRDKDKSKKAGMTFQDIAHPSRFIIVVIRFLEFQSGYKSTKRQNSPHKNASSFV